MLRGGPGPARDAWMARMGNLLPPDMPVHRLPPGITPDRLLGGMDLAATLAAGRPVVGRGVLAGADGGVLVIPMAERLPPWVTAALLEVLDTGRVRLEREGTSEVHPARLIPVLLDESDPGEEGIPHALLDRLGPVVTLHPRWRPPEEHPVAPAREPPDPPLTDDAFRAVVEVAAALGIPSLRPVLRTLAVARALARADGRGEVEDDLLAEAAALVLAPRARTLPPVPETESPLPESAPPTRDPAAASDPEAGEGSGRLADRVLEAVRPALPDGLLAGLAVEAAGRRVRGAGGRGGEEQRQPRHGRRVGSRPGDPRTGGRVDLHGTLRAAAPWQRLREAAEGARDGEGRTPGSPRRLRVRPGDLHLKVLARKSSVTTIFVVDASGSQALNRLAEAKGAVELLLAGSYVRRESVALISFRGRGAEVLLPPTRALARARRSLAGLPGGGGTPLASGLEAGYRLAEQVRREGSIPVLVLLTDGRANVARDGAGGRERAEEEARGIARLIRARGVAAVVVDSSPRGAPFASELAEQMGARCLRLPPGRPETLSAAVRL